MAEEKLSSKTPGEIAPDYAAQLWSDNRETAGRCLHHPFVRGLRDGSLPDEGYSLYIAQDAFFLDAFARAYALGVARSPDRESMRAFHALQSGVFEEQRLHESVAAGRGIDLTTVRPLAATRAYTDFLMATAFQASLGELLAAMTPCMRLYFFLGEELKGEGGDDTYSDWIEAYAGGEFEDLVRAIEALFNRHAFGSGREAESYGRAMDLEFSFFDSAWKAGF